MREDDWGQDRLPFHGADEPFLTTSFEEAAARLLFLAERHWPSGWLVGPGGCGKSSLLRYVRRELRRNGLEAVLVSLCGVAADEFWSVIAASLGSGTSESGLAARKTARALLVASSMMNRPVTILLDDADRGERDLSEPIASLVRMADSVTPRHTIILATAGAAPDDDLARRIDLRADLRPFTIEETTDFVAQRLTQAGSTVAFSAEAVEELFTATAGVPAAIVRAADLALLAARAGDLTSVTADIIRSAVTELRPADEDPLVSITAPRPSRFCA